MTDRSHSSRSGLYRRAGHLLLLLFAQFLSLQADPVAAAVPLQVEVRLYQLFGDLMGNEDYEGVVREADRAAFLTAFIRNR